MAWLLGGPPVADPAVAPPPGGRGRRRAAANDGDQQRACSPAAGAAEVRRRRAERGRRTGSAASHRPTPTTGPPAGPEEAPSAPAVPRARRDRGPTTSLSAPGPDGRTGPRPRCSCLAAQAAPAAVTTPGALLPGRSMPRRGSRRGFAQPVPSRCRVARRGTSLVLVAAPALRHGERGPRLPGRDREARAHGRLLGPDPPRPRQPSFVKRSGGGAAHGTSSATWCRHCPTWCC
jgi:hypothetical protein